jgi:hypothetical protein
MMNFTDVPPLAQKIPPKAEREAWRAGFSRDLYRAEEAWKEARARWHLARWAHRTGRGAQADIDKAQVEMDEAMVTIKKWRVIVRWSWSIEW